MKKSSKIKLILSLSFVTAGVVLMLIGLSMSGFSLEAMFDHNRVSRTVELSGDFTQIDIHTALDNVEILPSEGKTCTVEVYEDEHYTYEIRAEDGVLTVKDHEKQDWLHMFGYLSLKKVTICLPEQEYRSLHLDTNIGSVTLYGGLAIDEVEIHVDIGEIRVIGSERNTKDSDHVFKSMTLDTNIGSIFADSGLAVENGHYQTDIGSIEVSSESSSRNDYCGKSLLLQADIGSIYVDSSYLADNIKADTNIGSITVPKGTLSGRDRSIEIG